MRRLVAALAAGGYLLCAGTGATDTPPKLLVGVADDTPKWVSRPNGVLAVNRDLGLGAIRIMIPWRRGQTIPSKVQQVYLHRVALAAALDARVVLAFYGRARDAPLERAQRRDFCRFAAHVARRIPRIQDVVIWNEANNPTFWPRGRAADYERLLARCWDALHGVRGEINVIDSTAPHQSPATFLAAMGAAYRASGRMTPILDTFGHNAYGETSSEPPWARHDNGSIDEGDLDRLLEVLTSAFGGTAQPLPGQAGTTIWYLEGGFETSIPDDKRGLYVGRTSAAPVVPALSRPEAEATPVRDQAMQLREALELAYCQPEVGAFFNFQLVDDRRLAGWQSGLLWADGTRKPSYAATREAIAAIARDEVDCAAVTARP
jgi:hypothetical protein